MQLASAVMITKFCWYNSCTFVCSTSVIHLVVSSTTIANRLSHQFLFKLAVKCQLTNLRACSGRKILARKWFYRCDQTNYNRFHDILLHYSRKVIGLRFVKLPFNDMWSLTNEVLYRACDKVNPSSYLKYSNYMHMKDILRRKNKLETDETYKRSKLRWNIRKNRKDDICCFMFFYWILSEFGLRFIQTNINCNIQLMKQSISISLHLCVVLLLF